MQGKIKGILWSGLYILIALGVQLMIGLSMAVVAMSVCFTNGIGGSAISQMYTDMLEYFTSGEGAIFLTALCDLVTFVMFGLWYYFRENKYPFRPNYKIAFSRKNVVAILGIGIFGQLGVQLIMSVVRMILPGIFQSYEKLNEMLQIDSVNPILMLAIVCVLGPLSEELLFRGMIYAKLRRFFTIWPAAILSALAFGLFHGNVVQAIYATLFGIVLAYVYEKTQTIWGSCLLHVIFNSFAYVLEGIMKLFDAYSMIVNIVFLVFELVSIVLVIALMKSMGRQKANP